MNEKKFLRWLWDGMWIFTFFSGLSLMIGILDNNKALVATTFFFIGFTTALALVTWKVKQSIEANWE